MQKSKNLRNKEKAFDKKVSRTLNEIQERIFIGSSEEDVKKIKKITAESSRRFRENLAASS